jgi:hypothetical protein
VAAVGQAALRETYDEAARAGRLDGYRNRKWGRRAEFAAWLGQEALPDMDEAQALALYRCSGGRDSQGFKENEIEEVRDTFDFLLYDTIKLEGRFDECAAAEGAYKLRGAGKEFASYLLCLREPGLFGVWNANAERLLRRAGGYPESLKQGPIGIRYVEFLEALGGLRAQLGLGRFTQLDELAYLSARSNKV